ncbi:MAG: hypothetical protein CMH56_07265 [Myxococcales bacterium]|nr:hypothetical protein [Myxococcales bacterium]
MVESETLTVLLCMTIALPFLAAIGLVLVPAKHHAFLRPYTLITLGLCFAVGWLPAEDGSLWQHALEGNPISAYLHLGSRHIQLVFNAQNAGMCFALLTLLFTTTAIHPFHSPEKIKPFITATLLICAFVLGSFIVAHTLLSLSLALSTHFFFWLLMTQMGTGQRSQTALRVFSLFIVFDAIALGFVLAPESLFNFIPYPWALAMGTFLASWLRLGIFPFLSLHRWVARSISPSVALLFTMTQFILGIHFAPEQALSDSLLGPATHLLPILLVVHFLWIGLLSIGERRPMMIFTHAILLLSAFTLLAFEQIKLPFSIHGPWPWAMAALATLGLFVDELHNLKNDILASFEHAQVGLLKRWPQMHSFAQIHVLLFAVLLMALPLWSLGMPENTFFQTHVAHQWHFTELVALLMAFIFGLLSIHTALFQLWRRWNTPAPVERVHLPEGAAPPVVWRWHLSGTLGIALFWTGFLFHFS